MPDGIKLTQDEVRALQAQQPLINSLRRDLERMKDAGLPVDDLETQLDYNVTVRDGVLRNFSPNRPQ